MEITTKQIKRGMKTKRVNHGKTLNLNATVKSGIKMFAPTWDIVKDFQAGIMTQDVYRAAYRALMRRSFKLHPKAWAELLTFDTITIGCYCKPDSFCHRYLLADFIAKFAISKDIDCSITVENGGMQI